MVPTIGSSAAARPAFKVGVYQGKARPVILENTAGKLERTEAAVVFNLEPAAASACGGHGAATVLCLTNGLGGPFGQWDTEDVGGGEKVCGPPGPATNGINAGWTLQSIVPASGSVSVNEKTPGDASHVAARFVVHKSGIITGTVTQVVNVSSASTKGKTEPLCTTGTVSFTARFA